MSYGYREVDVTCDLKVNRNCELCRQKVTEMMHAIIAFEYVDFAGANNTMKFKARADPDLLIAIERRYGDHAKMNNLRFDGQNYSIMKGSYYGQSGSYLPGNYPYMAGPMYGYGRGNYCYPPPKESEESSTQRVYQQHTARPTYFHPPPPPKPLSFYSYLEPPSWPTKSGVGCCVIM